MGEFVAASGRKVTAREDGSVMFGAANGYLGTEAAMDAAEFFQAQRDDELGRWRYPSVPTCVVYPTATGVVVVDEEDGRVLETARDDERGDEWIEKAADAYFEAHPDESKPWQAAKPGEAWLLTVGGWESPFVSDNSTDFTGSNQYGDYRILSRSDTRITAGRRIWPAEPQQVYTVTRYGEPVTVYATYKAAEEHVLSMLHPPEFQIKQDVLRDEPVHAATAVDAA